MLPELLSKEEAIKQGKNKYFEGKRCKNGHQSERYLSGNCIECLKERNEASKKKTNQKRRERTKAKLAAMVLECKSETCNNKFTPTNSSTQLFCSKACSDRQGKRDWKKRNKKVYQESENHRRRKKYANDNDYRLLQRQRSIDNWNSLNDDEKLIEGRKRRNALDKKNHKEYMRKYQAQKYQTNPHFQAASALRSRIRSAIKSTGGKKKQKTETLIGCSIEFLMAHLEKQFTNGMTWANYGEWHIDHIRPVASFKSLGTSEEEQLECFHFSNLQPLWATDNLRKGAKYEE